MVTGFPPPLDDDCEDVVWGLTTGAALWRRGERSDALVWLHRAADAANEAGAVGRAHELARAVQDLRASPSDPAAARDELPSVMTSAPPLETLTHASSDSHALRSESPPPPTIVPDVELAAIPPVSAFPRPRALSATSEPSLNAPASARQPWAALEAIIGLTDEQRAGLALAAAIERLSPEEELTVSGLVLLVEGEASVAAAISEVPAARIGPGDTVLARGTIPDALPLRLIAESSATVITWDQATTNRWLADAPAVAARFRHAADRLQALAGSTIGLVGERLDAGLRSLLFERLEARAYEPGAIVAEVGLPVPGIVVVGVGSVELERDGACYEKLGPGDFLFATEVLGQAPAPARARAGTKGAVVLLGARTATYELLMSCPPLLEIFAGV